MATGYWEERFLETASGDESWDEIGRDLCGVLGTHLAGVQLRDVGGTPTAVPVSMGVDPDALAAYAAEYHVDDLHGPRILARAPLEVVDSDTLVSPRALLRSRYYREWMEPNDMRRLLAFWAPLESGVTVGAAFIRPVRSQPFSEGERAFLGSVMLPMTLALDTERHLARAESYGAHSRPGELADVLRGGLLLVEADGSVREANLAAGRMLGGRGSLPLPTPAARSAFERRSGAFFLNLDGQRVTVVLRPAPIRWAPAVVLAFVDEQTLRHSANLFRSVWDLTRVEAVVAESLAHGHDPTEVAEQLGIRRTTVRVHMRKVFRKMGVRTQSELVARVSRTFPK